MEFVIRQRIVSHACGTVEFALRYVEMVFVTMEKIVKVAPRIAEAVLTVAVMEYVERQRVVGTAFMTVESVVRDVGIIYVSLMRIVVPVG